MTLLSLDSNDWSGLTHPYGIADDIPDLLADLASYPQEDGFESEPFFSLWGALCHQGDTNTAAYASVPHIMRLAEAQPGRITYNFLLLPTSIEIARLMGRDPRVPAELESGYEAAVRAMPQLVSKLPVHESDETWSLVCCAAVAAASGRAQLAEAILELEGSVAAEFLKWKLDQ